MDIISDLSASIRNGTNPDQSFEAFLTASTQGMTLYPYQKAYLLSLWNHRKLEQVVSSEVQAIAESLLPIEIEILFAFSDEGYVECLKDVYAYSWVRDQCKNFKYFHRIVKKLHKLDLLRYDYVINDDGQICGTGYWQSARGRAAIRWLRYPTEAIFDPIKYPKLEEEEYDNFSDGDC